MKLKRNLNQQIIAIQLEVIKCEIIDIPLDNFVVLHIAIAP